MITVGLTGNIGSGKSFVAGIFHTLGIPLYSADAGAKSLYALPEVKSRLKELFGGGVFDEDNEPDRRKLAEMVFNDEAKLRQINDLIHPLVRKDFQRWMSTWKSSPYVIYEAAILFESGHNRDLDKVIMVTAPEDVRVRRVMQRDRVSEAEVRARVAHQWAEERKIPLADFVIINDGNQMVIPQVMEVHRLLLTGGR